MPANLKLKLCCGCPPLAFRDRKVGHTTEKFVVTCYHCGRFIDADSQAEAIDLWNAKPDAKSRRSRRP